MGHTIGSLIQLIISQGMISGLDRKPIMIQVHHLLETVRDRLLDLFLLELDEPPRRMEAFGPDSPLLPWRIRYSGGHVSYVSPLLLAEKARTY